MSPDREPFTVRVGEHNFSDDWEHCAICGAQVHLDAFNVAAWWEDGTGLRCYVCLSCVAAGADTWPDRQRDYADRLERDARNLRRSADSLTWQAPTVADWQRAQAARTDAVLGRSSGEVTP